MENKLKVYFSVKEICVRYGVGVSTIYGWMRSGSFPQPQKLGAKLIKFHIDDLKQWEEEQERIYEIPELLSETDNKEDSLCQ